MKHSSFVRFLLFFSFLDEKPKGFIKEVQKRGDKTPMEPGVLHKRIPIGIDQTNVILTKSLGQRTPQKVKNLTKF